MHDNQVELFGCDYCKGIRNDPDLYAQALQGHEDYQKLPNFMSAFTSGKFRIDDWETLLNLGYTRSGNYFYIRDVHRSCCEIYQYRVDVNQFKPNSQQRKVMKRFYRFLIQGKDKNEEEEEEKVVSGEIN